MSSFSLASRMILGVVVFTAVISCEQTVITDTTTPLTDAKIFETAKITTGYVWYKKSDAYLAKTAKSGHAQPLMRTRYNATAAAQLDANGKVKAATVFPEGSIITKELVKTGNVLDGYAVLWKRKADPNADADGWVWGYVSATGSVNNPITGKGNGCIGCHSIAGHIDRTLMNVSVN